MKKPNPNMLADTYECLKKVKGVVKDKHLCGVATFLMGEIEDQLRYGRCLLGGRELVQVSRNCLNNFWANAAENSTDSAWARLLKIHRVTLRLQGAEEEITLLKPCLCICHSKHNEECVAEEGDE